MKLQELFNSHKGCQVVLSFSNNNEVLITDESFNPKSKFVRRSKIRLEMDFCVSGVIKGETLIHVTEGALPKRYDVLIYRTYRGAGKTDYVVYVYTKEYKFLENIKRKVSHSRVVAQTDKHLTLNSITEPMPDKVLDICPHIDPKDNTYWVSYRHNDFKSWVYNSPTYESTYPHSYICYLSGVIIGLTIAKKYPDKITQVRVFHPDDTMAKGIYMFALRRWKPKNEYTIGYTNSVNMLKKELQDLGISVCFME